MATPPGRDGKVNPNILAAARVAGVKEIYKVGGAQAIAMLAYGTETVEPVFKIAGPGNAFVAMAKRLVYGTVGIDMIAGPSEVCCVADGSANQNGSPRTCCRRRSMIPARQCSSSLRTRNSEKRCRRKWKSR